MSPQKLPWLWSIASYNQTGLMAQPKTHDGKKKNKKGFVVYFSCITSTRYKNYRSLILKTQERHTYFSVGLYYVWDQGRKKACLDCGYKQLRVRVFFCSVLRLVGTVVLVLFSGRDLHKGITRLPCSFLSFDIVYTLYISCLNWCMGRFNKEQVIRISSHIKSYKSWHKPYRC